MIKIRCVYVRALVSLCVGTSVLMSMKMQSVAYKFTCMHWERTPFAGPFFSRWFLLLLCVCTWKWRFVMMHIMLSLSRPHSHFLVFRSESDYNCGKQYAYVCVCVSVWMCASVYDGKVCPHTFWLLGFFGAAHTLLQWQKSRALSHDLKEFRKREKHTHTHMPWTHRAKKNWKDETKTKPPPGFVF